MQWHEIPGWPGYRASIEGQIMSLKGLEPRILQPAVGDKGHLFVKLYREGGPPKGANCKIHQLMALTFLPPQPPGLWVLHNDGNPANNHIGNLRYGTPSENNLDAVRHGTHSESRRTHCDWGHEYTEANSMWRWGKGGKAGGQKYRLCRQCHNRRQREQRAKLKAKEQPLATEPGCS